MKNLTCPTTGLCLLLLFQCFYGSSQNVGIGTSSPQGRLHIKGNADTSQLVIDAAASQGRVPLVRLRSSFGNDQLHIHTDSSVNAFFGVNAGKKNTANLFLQGIYNTAVGSEAAQENVSGINNTALGYRSLFANTGSSNTALGAWTLTTNTTGEYSTGVGTFALRNNLSGQFNTATGYRALRSNETGDHNTATGYLALQANKDGNHNTAAGSGALTTNVSGWDNTAFGYKALSNSNSLEDNTAVGAYSLFSTQSGNRNTALGNQALYLNGVGSGNTAVGRGALFNNQSGYNNVAIGYASGTNTLGQYDNTVSIGNQGFLNGWHNQVFLGNLSTTWNGGNVNWLTYSDARVKSGVQEDVKGLAFVLRLRPVTYFRNTAEALRLTRNTDSTNLPRKAEIEDIRFSGFLAQEVEVAAQQSGYDFDGVRKPRNANELYSLSYASFVVPLVKAVQEQQQIIDELRAGLKASRQQHAELSAKFEALKSDKK